MARPVKQIPDHVIDFGYQGKITFYVWSYGGNKGAEAQAHYAYKTEVGHSRPSSLPGICETEGEKVVIELSHRMAGLDPAQLRALATWANAAAKNIEALIREGIRERP